jgi:hypothetical protein
MSVVRAFIEDYMNEAEDPRTVRQSVKRVEKVALDTQLSRVARWVKRSTSSKPKTKR